MKHFKHLALVCASGLAMCLTSCNQELEAPKPTTDGGVEPEASGTVIPTTKRYIIIPTGDLPSDLASEVAKAGGELITSFAAVDMAIAETEDSQFQSKASKIEGVKAVIPDIEIQWLEPVETMSVSQADYGNPPASGDNDFFFDLQWGHDAVDAPEAWNTGFRGAGAVVAVLDGGFDLDHPDLAPNIVDTISMVPGEVTQFDPAIRGGNFSHGSHVAGTVAGADNGVGIIGVAPEAQLMLVKVLSDRGSGAFSWIINGIIYAADHHADVINMSLGAYLPKNGQFVNPDGSIDKIPASAVAELTNALQKAVSYAYQRGTTVISSAGNSAINGQKDGSGISVPAELAQVINISATAPVGWALDPTTELDQLATYSNYGNKIDFAAPGGDGAYPGDELATVGPLTRPAWVFDLVFSASNNGWSWAAGTSMASPHASGVAALIIGKSGGSMSPAQVEAALKKSADDIFKNGRDIYAGHGRVNAYRAVADGI